MTNMYQDYPLVITIYMFFIGLIVGSFLNVVILRLPAIEDLADPHGETPLPKTLMGRSCCPHCGSKIHWKMNIPLISWIAVNGKSLCCNKSIHWRYPAIELVSAIIAAGAVIIWGFNPAVIVGVLLAWIALCLIILDFEHLILPDKLTYAFLWLTLLSATQNVFTDPGTAIFGAVAGFLFMGLIAAVFRVVCKREGLGGGDYKLMAGLGALAGPLAIPGIMGGACVTFIIYALISRYGNRGEYLPMGPFLILGFMGWMLVGPYY
ncbi:prepilin peptidase [Pseudomonas luteola]